MRAARWGIDMPRAVSRVRADFLHRERAPVRSCGGVRLGVLVSKSARVVPEGPAGCNQPGPPTAKTSQVVPCADQGGGGLDDLKRDAKPTQVARPPRLVRRPLGRLKLRIHASSSRGSSALMALCVSMKTHRRPAIQYTEGTP